MQLGTERAVMQGMLLYAHSEQHIFVSSVSLYNSLILLE